MSLVHKSTVIPELLTKLDNCLQNEQLDEKSIINLTKYCAIIELFAFNDLNLVLLEKANCVKLMADILQKCEKIETSAESKLLVHQTLKCIAVILRSNQITL